MHSPTPLYDQNAQNNYFYLNTTKLTDSLMLLYLHTYTAYYEDCLCKTQSN